ncbi:MAG: hypothetical protein V3S51_07830 [Dehalococcoidia bacterium]
MVFWKGMNRFKNIEIAQGGVQIGLPGGPNPPTTDYFVDDTLGASGNSGLGWGTSVALKTISQAMTKVTALGTRGRARIFVAPGPYAEDIITSLNTEHPFGQLIAVNPTKRSGGAAWVISGTTTEPALTVRARGWLIDGFEFDANTTDGCVFLDGTTSNSSAKFTELANCLFSGLYSGSTDFGVDTDHASNLVVIRDSIFFGFASRAITAETVVTEGWEIARCIFRNSANYIAPKGSKGFAESYIHDCVFFNQGGLFEPTIMIDMRVGRYNHITRNMLGGAYSEAGGYYASSTDFWYGNETSASHQASNPS